MLKDFISEPLRTGELAPGLGMAIDAPCGRSSIPADCGNSRPARFPVAFDAGDAQVLSRQGKIRFIVPERKSIPGFRIVARLASRITFLRELAAVGIPVADRARRA